MNSPACVQAGEMILRRTGLRPLRFTGARLAAFETCAGSARILASFALYRTAGHDYAAAWSCEPDPDAGLAFLPWHAAEIFSSLDPAIAAIETAVPVCLPDPAPAGDGVSAILLQAAETAAREASIRLAFATAAGTFLYDLCVKANVNTADP